MGAGGEDLLLSPAARNVYPFSIECKNQEAFSIWGALEQAEENALKETFVKESGETRTNFVHCPLVVFKRNKSKTYVALEFEEFLKLYLVRPNNE